MIGEKTGVQELQELQEFSRQKLRREDKDPRPVSRAYSEELPDQDGDGTEVHSATPELLNYCNSLIYHVRV
jgi:hypothetical protein